MPARGEDDITGVSMDTLLHRQCLEVLHAKTVKDFVRISVEFGRSMGFQSMGAPVHSPELAEVHSLTDAPPDCRPIFEDNDTGNLDPVFQHCKHSSLLIIWNQDTYAEAGQGALWEQQVPYGLRSGIGVAFHLPRKRHFVFGLNSDKRACCDRKSRLCVSLDVQQFAAHAQAAAFNLCMPYAPSVDAATPAPSELEALRRSMDGLSDREAGDAMSISEKEVLLRLRRAAAKLGCATEYETTLRAIRLGLLSCD